MTGSKASTENGFGPRQASRDNPAVEEFGSHRIEYFYEGEVLIRRELCSGHASEQVIGAPERAWDNLVRLYARVA